MELKDIRTIILGIVNRLKKTVLTIQGKVDVDFPETQKVEITNQLPIMEQVKVSNLDEVVLGLETSIREVTKLLSKPQAKPEEIKPSLIKGLADVKRAITSIKFPENADLSVNFDEVVSAIKDIEFEVETDDIVTGLSKIREVLTAFVKFTRHNEVRVYINEKQVEKLAKATAVAMGVSQQLLVTYEGITGRPVHVVGDGDKYVVSNVAVGGAVGNADGIPIAGEDPSGDKQNLKVDSSGNLKVTTTGATTTMAHGIKVVTTAGTDVALATSTACKRVTIQAQTDNTGWITVGATGVDATVATGTGIMLWAGDAYELDIDNLADVFIDSTISGEGVRFTYFV